MCYGVIAKLIDFPPAVSLPNARSLLDENQPRLKIDLHRSYSIMLEAVFTGSENNE